MKRKSLEIVAGSGTPRQKLLLKELALKERYSDGMATLEKGHIFAVAALKEEHRKEMTKLQETITRQQKQIIELENKFQKFNAA